MDNSGDTQSEQWSTPSGLVLTAALGALGALLWCVSGPDDPAGRLLIGVTAAALAAAAAYGLRARPRLTVDRSGIEVGGLRGRRRFTWPEVATSRLVRTRRFGREVATVEIETRVGAEERLHVFSRWELGADPVEVAERLGAWRTGRGPSAAAL